MLSKNISLENKTILITCTAGFVGSFLTVSILKNFKKVNIIGIDNLNKYYDVSLKKYRLKEIEKHSNKSNSKFTFIKTDISNKDKINKIYNILGADPEKTIHI